MRFPRKLCAPIDTWDRRKDVLECSVLRMYSESATMVPVPIDVRCGLSSAARACGWAGYGRIARSSR